MAYAGCLFSHINLYKQINKNGLEIQECYLTYKISYKLSVLVYELPRHAGEKNLVYFVWPWFWMFVCLRARVCVFLFFFSLCVSGWIKDCLRNVLQYSVSTGRAGDKTPAQKMYRIWIGFDRVLHLFIKESFLLESPASFFGVKFWKNRWSYVLSLWILLEMIRLLEQNILSTYTVFYL